MDKPLTATQQQILQDLEHNHVLIRHQVGDHRSRTYVDGTMHTYAVRSTDRDALLRAECIVKRQEDALQTIYQITAWGLMVARKQV